MGHGSAGVLVVQRDREDGARQAQLAVFHVGAVPFDAGHGELAAQIGGHTHEAAVRAVLGHPGKERMLREVDHTAVGVAVLTAHAVVTLVKQLQDGLHAVGAGQHVSHAGVDHVLLTQI